MADGRAAIGATRDSASTATVQRLLGQFDVTGSGRVWIASSPASPWACLTWASGRQRAATLTPGALT